MLGQVEVSLVWLLTLGLPLTLLLWREARPAFTRASESPCRVSGSPRRVSASPRCDSTSPSRAAAPSRPKAAGSGVGAAVAVDVPRGPSIAFCGHFQAIPKTSRDMRDLS